MEQPDPQLQPRQNSQPSSSQKPVTQELPHLVVEEPKRGVFGTLGIITLSLMLLGIPIGLFLVSQRTEFAPQAATEETVTQPEVLNGIFLESKLSFESSGGIIPVDVYVKSPLDQVNLVEAKLKFDPAALSVERIATSAAEVNMPVSFNKWIEASFDNSKGSASIISGLPTPGLKTGGANDEKVYLATIHLRPKKIGSAILQVIPESQVLRNSDNSNILRTGSELALNLTSVGSEASASATPRGVRTDEPLVVVTSPSAATNYSYFKPMQILWSSFNVDKISQVNLFINNELLGPIAQNLEARDGKFDWTPKDTLALHSIQPNNTFEIEVVGVSEKGEVSRVRSAPFGILGTEEIIGGPPNPGSFAQNQLRVSDISRALSGYLVVPLKDPSVDLNKDEMVNELDLFLIRMNLLQRGVIK